MDSNRRQWRLAKDEHDLHENAPKPPQYERLFSEVCMRAFPIATGEYFINGGILQWCSFIEFFEESGFH